MNKDKFTKLKLKSTLNRLRKSGHKGIKVLKTYEDSIDMLKAIGLKEYNKLFLDALPKEPEVFTLSSVINKTQDSAFDGMKEAAEVMEFNRKNNPAMFPEEVNSVLGHKDTKGKLPLLLVPPHAIEAIARVREYGNKKYGDPWKWLTCTTPEQYIEAALRHILKDMMGEKIDPESGLPHMDHALCSLAMAVELIKRK